tara:strand:+ start:141 stop:425 length:285 start_codon:yes stop_codon:yes gene_type:complete
LQEEIFLIGDVKVLGNWNTEKAVRLEKQMDQVYGFSFVSSVLEIDQNLQLEPVKTIEYKFFKIKKHSNDIKMWEIGPNREFLFPSLTSPTALDP